jgi:hypothetical protein
MLCDETRCGSVTRKGGFGLNANVTDEDGGRIGLCHRKNLACRDYFLSVRGFKGQWVSMPRKRCDVLVSTFFEKLHGKRHEGCRDWTTGA